jgi:hypothetical protein
MLAAPQAAMTQHWMVSSRVNVMLDTHDVRLTELA